MELTDIELQLKQSRESLEFALQSGRMSTWDIHLETNIVTCSPGVLELWGVNPQEFRGDRSVLQRKVHPEDVTKMNNLIDAAIRNDGIYEMEFRIHPSPGIELWVLSRGRCTYDPGTSLPVRLSGVVFDITEKKIKEKDLTAALEARDQFFMIAGHDQHHLLNRKGSLKLREFLITDLRGNDYQV